MKLQFRVYDENMEGDWTITESGLHFITYTASQRFYFLFHNYRRNNWLFDRNLDEVDRITPSGV